MTGLPKMTLSIASEFSRFPIGRYVSDGEFNATRFREEFLIPSLDRAIKSNSILEVELDGVAAYSSSFLEESFGGLVRSDRIDPHQIPEHLKIVASSRVYEPARLDAESYMRDAFRARGVTVQN